MASLTFLNGDMSIYAVELDPLNNSGVSGRAILLVDPATGMLTVDIAATGLEPGQTHIQHIHGFEDGTESRAPTIAQDTDGDGFVELAEGLATYGPIQLNLSLNPENSSHDRGADHDHTAQAVFPVAGADGVLSYRETFVFDAGDPNAAGILAGLQPLDAKEIVLHGQSTTALQGAGTGGEVDGTAGYKLVLPVAVGEVEALSDPAAVLAAVASLGDVASAAVDWDAVAAVVQANFDATGHWFL